jgi:hypothetical protein
MGDVESTRARKTQYGASTIGRWPWRQTRREPGGADVRLLDQRDVTGTIRRVKRESFELVPSEMAAQRLLSSVKRLVMKCRLTGPAECYLQAVAAITFLALLAR